jgi:hypothetical protein
LRLVVKGGGHSYQGTSNAPDSLLIWTRHMHDIAMHSDFVPQGCEHILKPQPAVTLGAGTIWMQAYDAVTTRGGKYVQMSHAQGLFGCRNHFLQHEVRRGSINQT